MICIIKNFIFKGSAKGLVKYVCRAGKQFDNGDYAKLNMKCNG